MLFAFVSGSRSLRRLSPKQAVFLRAFAGGVAAFGLLMGLGLLRFWLAPDLPPLQWIGLCMAFYAAFVFAGLTIWFTQPQAHSVFECGQDRVLRELLRLFWFGGATLGSAFVSRPPSFTEDGVLPFVGMALIIGLLAFAHSYHAGRPARCPSLSASKSDGVTDD